MGTQTDIFTRMFKNKKKSAGNTNSNNNVKKKATTTQKQLSLPTPPPSQSRRWNVPQAMSADDDDDDDNDETEVMVNKSKKKKLKQQQHDSIKLDVVSNDNMSPETTTTKAYVGTRFVVLDDAHVLNTWNEKEHDMHGKVVNISAMVNEWPVIVSLVGFIWSFATSPSTMLFDNSDNFWGYVLITSIFTAYKVYIALLMIFLQKQMVDGDSAQKRSIQSWPSPPIYAYQAVVDVLLYVAALIVFGILYNQRGEYSRPRAKTYEQFGLGLMSIPIYSIFQQLGVVVAPKLLRL